MIADAQAIVTALGGRWRGGRGMARCPAHDDREPSLSVTQTTDGRPLVHCFGTCSQFAVIDALRRRNLWPDGPVEADPSSPHRLTTKPDGLGIDDRRRRHRAYEIWSAAVPIPGTIAETYLRGRGITGRLPECLRYAPSLDHPSGYSLPALVGRLVTGLGEFTGIQRIFLERDGSKAKVEPRKMTLGPMLDGAVRLATVRDTIGIAEGIETALSAFQMYRIPTWACLGAGRLGKLGIPDSVETIIIFADNGDVGIREAHRALKNYDLGGYDVRLVRPDPPYDDLNSWLQAKEAA